MSGDRRAPWWYSGDGDGDEVESAAPPESAQALDPDDSSPDPDDSLPDADDSLPDADDAAPAMDWTALVAGAARMVDWATERVMAPHAEHTDPSEHPDCMVCRTVTLIGDPVGLMSGGPRPATDAEPVDVDDSAAPDAVAPIGVQPIRWIPIVEAGG